MVTLESLRRSWRAWLSSDDRGIGPWWASLVWTLAFAFVCGLVFTIINIALNAGDDSVHMESWWAWFEANMVVSLSITSSIRLLLNLTRRSIGPDRLRGWSKARRSIYFSVVPFTGFLIGWPVGMLLAPGVDIRVHFSPDRPGALIGTLALALLVTAGFARFFALKTAQIQAENRAAEAQLRLLQAQIEPHFLFNTLANVVSLIETDTPRAKAMLESFVDYLRASLAGFGDGRHTVGDEIDLVEAYMRIIKARMEDRLQYEIDVPQGLRSRSLPPLTLQPLVENAIVHGLEPQIAGGTIRIAAALERGSLVLIVEDNGAGIATAAAPTQSAGSGTALANIRERLQQLYGAAAALRLDAVAPHGVRARLAVPA
jgi:signal transduction histidine kinase